MPETDYGFKPSPDVRSFAGQIAHIADDQYNLCAPAKKETRKAAYTDIENRLSKKADLVPALQAAFAYCDAAYDALTDASAAEVVAARGRSTRFAWLNWNLWHTWEHYGNIVVYLRMKSLVPPSSDQKVRPPLAFVASILATGLAAEITGGRISRSPGNPLSADIRRDYQSVKNYVTQSAEKMSEADYEFKPSPDVRTFAQQIAHVSDDQYNLCASSKNETRKAAYTDIEDRLSKKADLVPALKEAFAYCDAAYDALTDASAADVVKFPRTRFAMLNWNLWHTWEHYGNIVVYLRIKGLVPPSSERTR